MAYGFLITDLIFTVNSRLTITNSSITVSKDARYERKESTNGKPMFNLKATNGQVIGTSELYESIAARENGIESVKKNAPDAEIVEE